MKRRTLESPEQRLFTFLATSFIASKDFKDSSSILAAQCHSSDLLQLARLLKFPVNNSKIAFNPQQAFSSTILTQISELKAQLQALHHEMAADEHQIEAEHRQYMASLHSYNEAKDVGQALLGKLAQLSGQTTRQLYPEFGLSLQE